MLAVDAGFCAPGYPNCTPPGTNIHYLGVGFDRNNTTAGDAFDSPADNAFLEIADAENGTDISPGYVLCTDNAKIGIVDTSNSSWPRDPEHRCSRGLERRPWMLSISRARPASRPTLTLPTDVRATSPADRKHAQNQQDLAKKERTGIFFAHMREVRQSNRPRHENSRP